MTDIYWRARFIMEDFYTMEMYYQPNDDELLLNNDAWNFVNNLTLNQVIELSKEEYDCISDKLTNISIAIVANLP